MIDGQKKVIQFCEEIAKNAGDADVADIHKKALEIADSAREQELIVPVVGGFSSGKSTLINNIIGMDILPVGITPETSLATELHYSPEEFIDAVKKDGNSDHYKVEEITLLKDRAAEYEYAKLFLKNDAIKEIEPLVLVDMPGFDSPLDQHNKAINGYLGRGCHYIVLSSVEEGNISKSLMRRLKFIDDFGRGFSFFLSKANLRPAVRITELVSHYESVISDNLDINVPVIPLGNESGKNVAGILKKIDANELFFSLYKGQIKDICYELIESLNIRINSLKASFDSNISLVKEMEDSIAKIQKKAEDLVSDIKFRYSGDMVSSVVNNDISKALEGALEELINIALSGRQEEVARRFNEIINHVLMTSVKNKLGDINNRIVDDFSSEIAGIDRVMKDYAIDSNYSANLANSIQETFSNLQLLAVKLSDPKFGGAWKAVTGILAITTSIVAPIVEVIIFFLPTIVGPIIAYFQKQKQQEQIRKKFLTEVFPDIKGKIKAELSNHLDQQIKLMIEQVRDQYDEKINRQREEVLGTIEMKKNDAANIHDQIVGLENIRARIQETTSKVLEGSYA
jgi:hypothetical protein